MTSSEQSSKDLQASETASQATAEATRETVESATIEAKNEEIAALRSHLSEEHGQLMGMHEHVAQLLGELAIAGNLLSVAEAAKAEAGLQAMMNVSAEGHLTQPQEQEMASLRTELAKEQTAMAGMYAVQTDHLGQLQTMTLEQNALLRQLDDLQERLRKQIESADIKTRALGECSTENSLLRDLLVTYQRLLLEIYDKATALVKLHRSTVDAHVKLHGKLEEMQMRMSSGLLEPERTGMWRAHIGLVPQEGEGGGGK